VPAGGVKGPVSLDGAAACGCARPFFCWICAARGIVKFANITAIAIIMLFRRDASLTLYSSLVE
jgi:hypothetical protein